MTAQPKRLNQVIAIEKTRKGELEKLVTGVYHWFQRQGPFDGFTKRYEPDVEDGPTFPPEQAKVQMTVPKLLDELRLAMVNLMDLTASKDATNGIARATLVVDGVTVLEDVPGVTLLFLDKQLNDLRTIISKLPTLDAAIVWRLDTDNDLYRSDEQWAIRQEKRRAPLVLYPATDKHPAQVKEIETTENVGKWYTVKFSGAIPTREKNTLLSRIDALRVSVKVALEEANQAATVEKEIGQRVFEFVLNGQ